MTEKTYELTDNLRIPISRIPCSDEFKFYDLGWLDGFSAVLWALVGDKLSDETVAEYEAHVKRLRKSVGMEGVEEWKS